MTGLWFLHSAIPFIALYHCIKFHLFIFNTFRDMLQTSLLLLKLEREITLKLLVIELQFLHSALPLMAVYQCIKFHLIPFYTFRNMLRTSFLLQKLRREVTPKILVIGLWFLHAAIPLMALYQCIKFHLITFNTFRDMLQTRM